MNYISTDIVCPFYRKDTGMTVSCEGTRPATSLGMTFHSARLCRMYKQDYCCGDYWDCDIAHMLECKYGNF